MKNWLLPFAIGLLLGVVIGMVCTPPQKTLVPSVLMTDKGYAVYYYNPPMPMIDGTGGVE
jgi:hypothetical protein